MKMDAAGPQRIAQSSHCPGEYGIQNKILNLLEYELYDASGST